MTEQKTDLKRWRGYTHEELYKMLHEGPGVQASAIPASRWAELTTTLGEIGHDLGKALDATGASWVGRAAGRAYDRLAPLQAWANTTADTATAMRKAVETQGDHIAKARADMPVPSGAPAQTPDPSVPAPALVAAGAVDPEAAEATQATGEQRAFEVMAAYEQATTANLATVDAADTAPKIIEHDNRNDSVRGLGITLNTVTSSAPVINVILGDTPRQPTPHGPQHIHGPHGQQVITSGATFTHDVPHRPLIAPGAQSFAAPMDSVLGLGPRSGSDSDREDHQLQRRPGSVVSGQTPSGPHAIGADGSGSGSGSGAGPGSGMGTGAAPAPVSSTGAAGAPLSPTAGGGSQSAGDRMALRRFGTDAVGSSQWFGDSDPVDHGGSTRSVSGRKRDLSRTEDQVTESVEVMGDDHQLPPGVIGG